MRGLLALLVVAAAAPSPEARYFEYSRAIQVPQDAAGQTCVVLDAETFTHAAGDLADVRLFRDGAETPFVLHGALEESARQDSTEPLNLGERDGRTVFDAAMPEGEYNEVQLEVTGRDFLGSVAVAGSQEMTGDATHIGKYTIFDLTNQKLGRSTVLHLPRSNFRYLHFEISGLDAHEQITGVTLSAMTAGEPSYITVADGVRLERMGRQSVGEQVTPRHVPVDRVVFVPPVTPVNFSREVQVKAAAERTGAADQEVSPLSATASTNLLRIHRVQNGRRIDEEHLAVDAPRGRFFDGPAKWTISVENGDDAPVDFASVRLEMLERRVCFEATAGAGYVLYYGDSQLASPHYDYAAWFAPQSATTVANLGPERKNPEYRERPDRRAFTERHPALLWVALVGVVMLLGGIALRTGRRFAPQDRMP